jgi:hypothetical protein
VTSSSVPESAPVELEARSSRAVGFVLLAVGGLALAVAAVWDPLRTPLRLSLVAIVGLLGAWRLLDRRVRLAITPDGIRYADWGPALVPWQEFSGYAWTRWRQNPYLQLIPRRPSELVATFSALGRLGHLGARWLRMPRFSIAVTPLDVSHAALDEAVSRHLPRGTPAPE